MIWLVGCHGMLGSEIAELLAKKGYASYCSDREVDVTNESAIADFARGKAIEWIVNCAGYTAVDKAEEEVARCRALNSGAPGNLGRLARSIGAKVVHVSTDYVFDGMGTRPYVETDPVRPIGVYGESKVAGERALLEACPRSYIVRTAWLYGRHGNNFVHTMLRLMSERDRISVVSDQYGTPTKAGDLAIVIVSMIESGKDEFGVYHYTNEGQATWYEFARAIHDEAKSIGLLSRDCVVVPITMAEYPTKARRPVYSVLSKSKIGEAFGLSIPTWRDSLRRYLREEYLQLVAPAKST